MRAVVQRVNHAEVRVDEQIVGRIQRGLCVLVGVMDGDSSVDALALAKKVSLLRIFTDEQDKMNRTVSDENGAVLAISQFTLAGDVRKGNRPSFMSAMSPDPARVLFDEFCVGVRAYGLLVETGTFRAHMKVSLENDGPVTILLDTKRQF